MADDIHQELYAILAECWDLLERAARDSGTRLHEPVLATSRPDGTPDARTVLVESAEAATRRIIFNTDARSPKVCEMAALPRAVLVFCDGTTQLRARAHLTLHRGNATARRSWEALPEHQRIHYRSALPPGTAIGRASALHRPGFGASPDEGWENYLLVEAMVTSLDWLRTDDGAGRRALFTWSEDGYIQGQWLVP